MEGGSVAEASFAILQPYSFTGGLIPHNKQGASASPSQILFAENICSFEVDLNNLNDFI